MRGHTLTVRGAGREGRYDLTGTFRALGATMDCAARYFDHAPTHTPPDRTAAFQLATTVLTGLGIRDFRFLSQGELEEMGQPDSVAWTAPEHGLFGWSLLVPRSPGQYELRDTAYLVRKCGGDYATSSRSIPLPGTLSCTMR